MKSAKIPFSVLYQGSVMCGFLEAPHGAGMDDSAYPHTYHVMCDCFYFGCLQFNQPLKDWWLPDPKLWVYEEYFGELVTAWFE